MRVYGRVRDGVGDPLRVREGDADVERDWDEEGVLDRRVRVAVTLGLRDCDDDVVGDRLRELETEGVEDTVVDRDLVDDTVPVGERVRVGDPLEDRDGDGLTDIVRLGDVVADHV